MNVWPLSVLVNHVRKYCLWVMQLLLPICYTKCAEDQLDQESEYKAYRCEGMYQMMRADLSPGGWIFDNDTPLEAIILAESLDGVESPIDTFSDADQLRLNWRMPGQI